MMKQGTARPDQLFGATVRDSAGDNVGDVDGVWVDDATDELEFIGIKTGFIAGKTHLIPMANASVADGSVTVPYSKDQIKDAPSFGTDDALTPENEDEIYSYYGLDRSTAPSPSGLPAGDSSTQTVREAGGQDATGDMPTDPTHAEMTLSEEELVVGKRQVEYGRVRLRKVVRTEHEEVPINLRHEEIEIERVPASSDSPSDSAFGEQEINVPLMGEEAVVNKQSYATEQVRLNKTNTTETETVGGDVRRTDVEIDQGTVDQYVHTPDESR